MRAFAKTITVCLVLGRRASLLALGARSLEIPLEGAEPPSEFRLFKSGENETTKGVFLFDAAAAEAVMSAAAQRGGVDYPIDLEHLSLESTDSRGFDPDARGWFTLAVRNGELWAVNVRWTPDGQRRLNERTQRYVSPAFTVDDEGRVTEIVNVALVAMPATHGTPALVAANRRPRMKTLKDRKNELAARLSIAKSKIQKLANGEGEAPSGKFAAVQAAAQAAADALATLDSVSGVDEAMGALDDALAKVKAFEDAAAAMGSASSDAPATDAAEGQAMAAQPDDAQKMARMEAELVSLRKANAQREHEAQVAKLAAEMDERRTLVATLVKLGRETPATAWSDETATTPRGSLGTMPLDELRARVAAFGGSKVALGGVQPPRTLVTASGPAVEIGEFEAARVKAYAEKKGAEIKAAGGTPRTPDEVLSAYVGHREQQFRGAKGHEAVKALGRRIEEGHVLLSRDGRLVTLASTPVKPIEEFGPSSQRANEEFRMVYNMALAAEPKVWAETLGDLQPSGSVTKDTFPINLSAVRYTKKKAQEAGAETSMNFDISVTKDEFYAAEEVELRRLSDFAHVISWNRRAERMARARVFLRNELVTTILEAGTTGYWGQSTELATGIDGQPFFSATHKVHPRDPSKKLRGVATWSNYQSTAKPLSSVNLTAQKVTAFQVADPSGKEFGYSYDAMLYPSSLDETARNLLTVQDLILEAGTTNGVSNTFAATKNPHYQSGMEAVRAPDLAGTDTTANWYLVSRAAISAGLFPWMISEDGSEDLRTWDESSDFYKDTGFIKVSSHIYLAAVLLFPHSIRKIVGA